MVMFDSHVHVAFEQFDKDRDQVIKRAQEAGVEGWIEIGADLESSKKAIALAGVNDNVFASVGVHPDHVAELNEDNWELLESLVREPKVVAVGEIGFDYFRDGKYVEQLPAVNRFIAIARDNELPVIWHVRSSDDKDAHEDLIGLLSNLSDNERPGGVAHTFSGNVKQAEAYLELGLYIGVSGVVTFKNAGQLVEVVKVVPLDKLLIETDCPFLTPEPHRGQRNEPSYVQFVAKKIAEIKGVNVNEVERVTQENTYELFLK